MKIKFDQGIWFTGVLKEIKMSFSFWHLLFLSYNITLVITLHFKTENKLNELLAIYPKSYVFINNLE